jgi:hypothetical protein
MAKDKLKVNRDCPVQCLYYCIDGKWKWRASCGSRAALVYIAENVDHKTEKTDERQRPADLDRCEELADYNPDGLTEGECYVIADYGSLDNQSCTCPDGIRKSERE